MDSEKISCHSLEEEQSDTNADVLKKCGNILFTTKHDLKFSCIFCEKCFIHLDKFREHVLNYHIDNLDSTIAFDSSLEIKPENFVSCEYEESFASCESYKTDKNMKLVFDEDPEIKNEASLDIEMEEDRNFYSVQVDQNLEQSIDHSIFSGVDKKVKRNKKKVVNTSQSTLKYSCEFCTQTFNLLENLTSHFEKDHVNEFPHKCSYCNKRYVLCKQKTIHEQITHLGMHKGEKFVECNICFNTYKNIERARLHKRIHIVGMQVMCSICNKIFSHTKHLTRHLSTHNKPFACKECPESFRREKQLDWHVASHFNPKIYDCKICNESFPQPYKLMLHKQVVHKRGNENLRNVLDPKLSNNENIEVKMDKTTMSSSSRRKEYECETCHQKIIGKSNFKQHKDDHQPSVCEICTKKFKSQLGLKLHIKNKKCSKNSYKKSDLNISVEPRTDRPRRALRARKML